MTTPRFDELIHPSTRLSIVSLLAIVSTPGLTPADRHHGGSYTTYDPPSSPRPDRSGRSVRNGSPR